MANPIPLTLRVIRNEHQALAAMLRSIPLLLAQQRSRGIAPDFEALRAMLFYVDEFPERLHHPKESLLLFPKLRARAPQLREVLDQLEDEHERGERAIRDLEHALLAYEMLGEPRRDAFETLLQRYVSGYLQHMGTEERDILPAAERLLSEADWRELDEAFARNQDPLAAEGGVVSAPDGLYQALFQRILNALPAPLGLAPAV
ncbi:hemerythrin domain-containing protein [Pelomonas sp. CA6]|uniref:hemerythrin domain-containing protein n=1 Tax=Pelomonas sp. CA6 TaxID=2907999 RepID=UPI001F4C4B61|nr:hemerythrin domain-containing protein [Pelomonas sp. CA6]MCH7343406.1 hemerythrin domain-containing protein [Pelomonas sp. CA6]